MRDALNFNSCSIFTSTKPPLPFEIQTFSNSVAAAKDLLNELDICLKSTFSLCTDLHHHHHPVLNTVF